MVLVDHMSVDIVDFKTTIDYFYFKVFSISYINRTGVEIDQFCCRYVSFMVRRRFVEVKVFTREESL